MTELPTFNLAQVRTIYLRTSGTASQPRDIVARYCEAFAFCCSRGMDAETFARAMRAISPITCDVILDRIGMHPSSEPELAALQRLV